MATRDGPIEDLEEFGSDVRGYSAIPRRVEPECSFSTAPAPILFLTSVSIINGMNINIFIFQIMFVTTGIQSILVNWFHFIKNLFIAGNNVEPVINILGNILQY